MRKISVTLLLFLCSIIVLNAQSREVSHSQLFEIVEFLASDELKGRETGSESEAIAAKYIAIKMKKFGLSPKGTNGFFQSFTVETKDNPHAMGGPKKGETINGKNVVGYIDNNAANTIVIGAHFDHLGEGGEGSLYTGKEPAIHNGADDNASGVALLLNLAEEFSKDSEEYNQLNYLFIAFSGEEKGLWGSNYYCKNPTIDLMEVSYMINFDMVGRFDDSKGLAINGIGTSPFWKDALKSANEQNLKLITTESGVGPSDHTSFYLQDLPVLHFFTGQHEDYHKPSDDADKINYDGIATIGEMVINLVKLSQNGEKLEFTKTKDESRESPTFSVTLGVMPDYMFQGEGMRIDGVSEGRTADKAGLLKGDVVIQIGKIKVDGMQGYMKALGKYKKGDTVTVKVKRDDKVVEKSITF